MENKVVNENQPENNNPLPIINQQQEEVVSRVPVEVWIHIFLFVEKYDWLVGCSRVNRLWRGGSFHLLRRFFSFKFSHPFFIFQIVLFVFEKKKVGNANCCLFFKSRFQNENK